MKGDSSCHMFTEEGRARYDQIRWNSRRGKPLLKMENGSSIEFSGADEPKIQGITPTMIIIDDTGLDD